MPRQCDAVRAACDAGAKRGPLCTCTRPWFFAPLDATMGQTATGFLTKADGVAEHFVDTAAAKAIGALTGGALGTK